MRYDRVGAGLSDRERGEFTLEAEVAQLEAVVRHLRLDRFTIFAQSCGAPTAIAYAARHPEAVSQLVLAGGYASGQSLAPPDIQAALIALVRVSWGLGSKALADLFAPGLSSQDVRDFVVLQRVSATAEMAARLLQLTFQLDVEGEPARVRAPTLVLTVAATVPSRSRRVGEWPRLSHLRSWSR